MLSSLLSLGVLSFFGRKQLIKDKIIYCDIEDFWDTVKYEEEWENGQIQRNIYRIEDYPKCSVFKKIKFRSLRKGDHFIILTSKSDYMGHASGYGFISKAESEVFIHEDTYGISLINIKVERCWTEKAFEKHMILSGVEYLSPSGHYKHGVRIG
jgi:hypothetical protein